MLHWVLIDLIAESIFAMVNRLYLDRVSLMPRRLVVLHLSLLAKVVRPHRISLSAKFISYGKCPAVPQY